MKRKVVLCVDDEKIVLESLESQLGKLLGGENGDAIGNKEMVLDGLKNVLDRSLDGKYEIELAESGEEALEIITELHEEHDSLVLVISDYIMPQMKGDELLIKTNETFSDAKLIMLTGQADVEGIANVTNKSKLYRYISKPWEKSDLLLTIKEALKSYEQDIRLREHNIILEQTVKVRTKELQETLADLKQSQEKLVQSEKLASLGQLVAGVAHEINTPVGVGVTASSFMCTQILKIKDMVASGEIDKDDFNSIINNIDESGKLILSNLERAAGLIHSFKQTSADQISEEKRSFEMKEVLSDTMRTLHPKLKSTRIKHTINCPENFSVKSYPGAISQIVTNLVMNSLMHAFDKNDEGNINISVEKSGNESVVLSFSDDGKGIPKNIQKKIFDPFVTTKRAKGGTGLGLNIIFNIVNNVLQGKIHCESNEGKGAIFTITMPQEISSGDL